MATDDPTIAPTASDEVRSMRTFALTVAYDGSHYAGWQSQPNGPTIQQTLAQAISRVVHHNVNPQGAGRTDAGVHAIGQVATFSSPNWKPPAQTLALAINGFLPRSISVIESKSVVPNFDPIRSASSKRYRYTIRSSRVPDPLLHPFHWWIPKELNTCNMQAAANRLLGTHDFKAFETLGSPRKTSVRTIHALDVNLQPTLGGSEITIEIEADGFLYNMVRNIAGALVEIGKDRFSPLWIDSLLNSPVRPTVSQTAPARGLCLLYVKYPPSLFLDL